jgi:ferredoxin-NADP reductase
MVKPQQCVAKLADKHVLNDKYVQLFFECVQPSRFAFDAGQYVSIAIPDGSGERRSYSICSRPDEEHGFELLIDVTPHGKGTNYLTGMAFGQEMQFLAPLGRFIVPPEVTANPQVFVATGSGVAPFRSMILDQLQTKKNAAPMLLYLGLRHVEELFWEDEFEELAQNFPNFRFHPVISQALPEWPLCRGHVTDCFMVHETTPNSEYYLCGNQRMIDDMMRLIQEKGIAPEKIHHEQFF